MRAQRLSIVLVAAALMLLMAGCRESAQPTPTQVPVSGGSSSLLVDVQSDPTPPVVGAATLIVTISDGGAPATGLTVSARGDMTHAGMAPVLGEGTEVEPGVYHVPWDWNMGGDWFVTVTVRTADGAETESTVDLTVED